MHNTSRNCTRCGKDLTDAASQEAGIGPVCRDLDNALLARLIPSDLAKAQAAFENVDLTAVAPPTLKTLNEVYGALNADGAAAREDWRLEVKRIEWSLSYPANNYMRSDLTNVVAALGYIGLAALWSGEAKTGKAQVTFMNNRLVIQAAKCKAANVTFRAIQGKVFHSVGTLTPKAAWSFPAKAYNSVYLAVIKHYPNFEGLTEAIEQAQKFVTPAPGIVVPGVKQVVVVDTETVPYLPLDVKTTTDFAAAQASMQKMLLDAMAVPAEMLNPAPAKAPAKQAAPKCSITTVGVLLKVASPYNPEFISDLKREVKWTDRRWNAGEHVWEITMNCEAKVKSLLTKHYGVAL